MTKKVTLYCVNPQTLRNCNLVHSNMTFDPHDNDKRQAIIDFMNDCKKTLSQERQRFSRCVLISDGEFLPFRMRRYMRQADLLMGLMQYKTSDSRIFIQHEDFVQKLQEIASINQRVPRWFIDEKLKAQLLLTEDEKKILECIRFTSKVACCTLRSKSFAQNCKMAIYVDKKDSMLAIKLAIDAIDASDLIPKPVRTVPTFEDNSDNIPRGLGYVELMGFGDALRKEVSEAACPTVSAAVLSEIENHVKKMANQDDDLGSLTRALHKHFETSHQTSLIVWTFLGRSFVYSILSKAAKRHSRKVTIPEVSRTIASRPANPEVTASPVSRTAAASPRVAAIPEKSRTTLPDDDNTKKSFGSECTGPEFVFECHEDPNTSWSPHKMYCRLWPRLQKLNPDNYACAFLDAYLGLSLETTKKALAEIRAKYFLGTRYRQVHFGTLVQGFNRNPGARSLFDHVAQGLLHKRAEEEYNTAWFLVQELNKQPWNHTYEPDEKMKHLQAMRRVTDKFHSVIVATAKEQTCRSTIMDLIQTKRVMGMGLGSPATTPL